MPRWTNVNSAEIQILIIISVFNVAGLFVLNVVNGVMMKMTNRVVNGFVLNVLKQQLLTT